MGKIFNSAVLTNRRKELRKRMPEPEHRLWQQLRARQLRGYKFRRQVSIGGFIVDFFCPELKIAIEMDGDSHFQNGTAQKHDLHRQRFIESFGIRVLRFTNIDIMESLDGVVSRILESLPERKTSPTPPCQGGA